jgi:single-stranded-DNA-specific exonuclease
VAYHLLWALHSRLGEAPPLQYADIAAIGTVADVAPLLGPNRALVREGLARLPASAWPGVRAMLATARLHGEVTARDVAFVFAPRLNAAGRLGEPENGLDLLLTDAPQRAERLAIYLDARNDERKRIQDDMFEQAAARVK